jgi:hypothetical protein
MLRLDVGIHVVELNWSRNTKSEGNGIDLQYQCCCLDAGVIEFWAIPRWGAWYWRGGGAGVVEYLGNWDGFPVPNSVSIQTLKFGFTNSNSKIWASIPASKRSIRDIYLKTLIWVELPIEILLIQKHPCTQLRHRDIMYVCLKKGTHSITVYWHEEEYATNF